MICCALISCVVALPIWLVSRARAKHDPLAWRLDAPNSGPQTPRTRFTFAARLRSFVHAARGLRFLIRNEHNARLHLAATAVVIGVGLLLEIDRADWRWIAVALLWVWSAEALNTAIEQLCNLVSPGPDERVRVAKDVAAGAVLVSAVGAAVIGVLTLSSYVM